ncbi:MAG: molybdenum cofactor guanylyltransferase [Candidatus Bathyarchaeota archaeon]|nr:molybdenum cofactor guanylyltransferase [Candidatus Termiticorpusculum sp.]
MTKRTAFVLSGGKACRFQTQQQKWQDKALALLNGKPLLVHVIENVSDVVDEVIVCVDNEERKMRYVETIDKYQLCAKFVIDEKSNVKGPNIAILTGLKAVQTDHCITIPCDMPFVNPKVTDYLFNTIENFDVVIPIWPNGTLETLIMVLQHHIGLEILQTLCQLNRSHPCDIPRATTKTLLATPLKTIKALDSNLKSFININTQKDLENLQTRSIKGSIQEDICLTHGDFFVSDLQLMRDAIKLCQEKQFTNAQKKFEICKNKFNTTGNYFWAALANESIGTILSEQLQYKKTEKNLQTTISKLELEYKNALFNAASCYHLEVELYEKNHCTRLFERATTDRERVRF